MSSSRRRPRHPGLRHPQLRATLGTPNVESERELPHAVASATGHCGLGDDERGTEPFVEGAALALIEARELLEALRTQLQVGDERRLVRAAELAR